LVTKKKLKEALVYSEKASKLLENSPFDGRHLEAVQLRAKIFLLSGNFEAAKKALLGSIYKIPFLPKTLRINFKNEVCYKFPPKNNLLKVL
jgi:hypothetical protein